jgi:subtilisin family serine protease
LIFIQSFYIVNMIKVTGDRGLMEELAARNDVAHIDANPLVKTALPNPDGKVSAQEAQGIEWNVARVKAPDVWNLGYTGTGYVVSGADTGVQWDHPSTEEPLPRLERPTS